LEAVALALAVVALALTLLVLLTPPLVLNSVYLSILSHKSIETAESHPVKLHVSVNYILFSRE